MSSAGRGFWSLSVVVFAVFGRGCAVCVGGCGGGAQPAGPSLPGQGRLRRR